MRGLSGGAPHPALLAKGSFLGCSSSSGWHHVLAPAPLWPGGGCWAAGGPRGAVKRLSRWLCTAPPGLSPPRLPCQPAFRSTELTELPRAGVQPLPALLGGSSLLFGYGASQEISRLPMRLWGRAQVGAGLHLVPSRLPQGCLGQRESDPGGPTGHRGVWG